MEHRKRVADFWDDVVHRWIEGEDIRTTDPLCRWFESYAGRGAGAVDLDHYPDPYVGDLRGEKHTPRLVLLGLNPGIGYHELQSHEGIWTKRIRDQGLSRCFSRSPAEDSTTWQKLHGGPSTYWANLIRFAQRWLKDNEAGVHNILNMELYPWHSRRLVGKVRVPREIADAYVFAPISEVPVDVVFAFGAPWFNVAESLGLELRASPTGEELLGQGNNRANWRVSIYRLNTRQVLVVSAQAGYAGPPGQERLERLRPIIENIIEN